MTKNLFVPDHILANRRKKKEEAEEKSLTAENVSALEQLPRPTGWRVLVLPYAIPKKTKSGIHMADETVEKNRLATNVGYVVSVGPDAYKDEEKFSNGAWCKKGDWVMFGRYAGSRFKIIDGELRILNDDEIIAVLDDPTSISIA
jgi:chaperonin GroES